MIDVTQLLNQQENFFKIGQTLSLDFRKQELKALKDQMKVREADLMTAMQEDLGKPSQESFLMEIGALYDSINHMIKHMDKWTKTQKARTPFYLLGKSRIAYEPYGKVLIIAPFNYPVQLALEPLIGALAAGNTVVLKPSELTPNTSRVLEEIVTAIYPADYVAVVQGAVEETTALLKAKFDYIFFTGSVPVGKIVMKAAAEHLTPVTLELGGKSPVIVDRTADLKLAARRIIWGKLINNGQTCIAPDYLLVEETVKADLVAEMQAVITEFYGDNIQDNPDYGRIVNTRHARRLADIIEADKAYVIIGGETDVNSRYIAPTLLDIPDTTAASMQGEIFGPILPILTVKDVEQAIDIIQQFDKPLALYIFSKNRAQIQQILRQISSGNVSINDTMKHAANPNLPFGGVGSAGIGAYHGKHSIDTFSHQKGIYENTLTFDVKTILPPYNIKKLKQVRTFIR